MNKEIRELYEDAPEFLITKIKNHIINHYYELLPLKIKVFVEEKELKSRKKFIFAYVIRPSEYIKLFTNYEFDYIIVFNKLTLGLKEVDLERVISHELRHIYFQPESKNPYRLKPHNYNDFIEEIELNSDDPRWAQNCVQEIMKNVKKKKRGRPKKDDQLKTKD